MSRGLRVFLIWVGLGGLDVRLFKLVVLNIDFGLEAELFPFVQVYLE